MMCPIENVIVSGADTDTSPYDSGSYASSTTYITGRAVEKACRKLQERIVQEAAKILNCESEELEFAGDSVKRLATGEEVSLTQIGTSSMCGSINALEAVEDSSSPVSPPPFMAGAVELEIDMETGETSVINYAAAVDCGTPINPNLARVQTEGGIAQGIGMALWEDVQYTDKGKIRNNSFMQYKIPTRQDIGNIRVDFECSYEKSGPFGAKSIGELVIDTPCPALAEAIYNATGVRLTELPMTPEKIAMEILKNRESTRSGTKVEE